MLGVDETPAPGGLLTAPSRAFDGVNPLISIANARLDDLGNLGKASIDTELTCDINKMLIYSATCYPNTEE
jgi:hypothetical protein